MAKEILVPDIGDFADVDVIDVLVSPGDTIAIDDPLITLESDKASMDIPATEGGVVREVIVQVGDKVSQGAPILLLENSRESSVHVAAAEARPRVSGERAASSPAPSGAGGGYGGAVLEDIRVPDIGDFSDVDVIEVLVSPGDAINEEDPLITLESDKASMDVPSPRQGTVKEVRVAVGDKVSEGSVILTLETAAAAATAPGEPRGEDKPAARTPAAETPEAAAAFRRAHASPSVRRIARELGVPLGQVAGTGRLGRITELDVRTFKNRGAPAPAPAAPAPAPAAPVPAAPAPAAAPAEGLPVLTQPDWSKWGEVSEVPTSRINRLSAAHLRRAWLNVPQVTHFDEADITELEAYRQEMKGKAKELGFNLTPLVFMMKAVVSGLKAFPRFNAAMSDDGSHFIQRHYFHLGIAVDTPDGLVVPVVRDVDRKGLYELARELGDVSARARAGKLTPNDMQGGCFSISSLGGIGGTNFTPIVNAPEVGILGLTRAQWRLQRRHGEIVDRLIQPLAVSYYHRVIDGALAARFVSHLAHVLSDVRNLIL